MNHLVMTRYAKLALAIGLCCVIVRGAAVFQQQRMDDGQIDSEPHHASHCCASQDYKSPNHRQDR